MKKKIITAILIILFTLCFSNCLGAYNPGDRYEEYIKEQFEKKYGYSMDFCSSNRKQVDAIYRTMMSNPNAWLDAKIPTMTNGWNYGWKCTPCNDAHNGIGTSMVWSKGGACCGHNGEAGGADNPTLKIKVFDVIGDEFINDTDSNAVKEEKRRKAGLAFACLYRWKTNEYIPKSLISTIPEGKGINQWIEEYVAQHPFKAREAIANWLANEPTITSSQIADFKNYLYDSNYGTISVGGTNYNAKSYIASKSNVLTCNQEKMNQDKQNGIEPTVKRKTISGKNYTLIGPYRIDIKGKIDTKMQYINSQNQTVNISAVGYTTSETGAVNTFNVNTVLSSTYNQCYLVFDGHRDIKKIQNIKIQQEVTTIRARMVFAESVDWGRTTSKCVLCKRRKNKC